MQDFLIEMLVCPVCHGELVWEITEESNHRLVQGMATCRECEANYPVRDEIGLFLTPDLPRDDLWAQVDSRLNSYLQQNPDLEYKLLGVPIEALNPADKFLRGSVLEARGAYLEAKAIMDKAFQEMYTAEYLAGSRRQIEYVVEKLQSIQEPIVDVASGRGALVEALLRAECTQVIGIDFSPNVLRINRQRFKAFGLYDHLSLIAADARRTPFKKKSIPYLTSYVGLMNIPEAGLALAELKRVSLGQFWCITIFYAPDDLPNVEAIRQLNLGDFLFEEGALKQYADVAWEVSIENRLIANARPTPKSEVFSGIGIDGLPVVETQLEWCILV